MAWKRALAFCWLGLGLFGCKDFGEVAEDSDWPAFAMNSMWTLYAFQLDGSPMQVPMGQVYWLFFESPTTFRAQSECNSCSGTCEVGRRNSIAFRVVMCTNILCEPPTLDGIFRLALRRVSSYQYVYPGRIILVGDNGKTVLSFFRNIR
ncbi:MAG TPA: META domain-containing protein [Bacteroidota bacterium]|nr:META domain-containing protein [Bacteroidota bacterium]